MSVHPSQEQVIRIRALSPDQFRKEFYEPAKPVVITGALDWPALKRWSHEWFQDQFGATEVELSVNPTHTRRVVRMRLDAYIDRIKRNFRVNGGLYLDQFPLERLPALRNDFTVPQYCVPDRKIVTHLWLGPGTTVLGFHKDNLNPLVLIDNIFVQVSGRKRVILASPDNDRLMYRRPPEAGASWHSEVNPEAPDFERFPLFAHARLQEAVVGPGEIIYIPRNYWHYVRALESSISLSFWWHPFRLMEIAGRVGGMDEAALAATQASSGLSISQADIDELGGPECLQAVFGEFDDHEFLCRMARNLSYIADKSARGIIDNALAKATAAAA